MLSEGRSAGGFAEEPSQIGPSPPGSILCLYGRNLDVHRMMMMCHFLRTPLRFLDWLMPGFGPPVSTDSSLIFGRAAVTWLGGWT